MASLGQIEIEKLSSGGFSSEEINEYTVSETQKLISGGFSQEEINEYRGNKAPNDAPIRSFATKMIDTVLDEVVAEDKEGIRPSVVDVATQAFHAGYDNSVIGLVINQGLPTHVANPSSSLRASLIGAPPGSQGTVYPRRNQVPTHSIVAQRVKGGRTSRIRPRKCQ